MLCVSLFFFFFFFAFFPSLVLLFCIFLCFARCFSFYSLVIAFPSPYRIVRLSCVASAFCPCLSGWRSMPRNGTSVRSLSVCLSFLLSSFYFSRELRILCPAKCTAEAIERARAHVCKSEHQRSIWYWSIVPTFTIFSFIYGCALMAFSLVISFWYDYLMLLLAAYRPNALECVSFAHLWAAGDAHIVLLAHLHRWIHHFGKHTFRIIQIIHRIVLIASAINLTPHSQWFFSASFSHKTSSIIFHLDGLHC